jgi:hypothetical protein
MAAAVDDRVVVVDGGAGTVLRDVPIGAPARRLELARSGDRLLVQRLDDTVVAVDLVAGAVHDGDAAEAAVFDQDTVDPTWPGRPSSSFRAFAPAARRAVLTDEHGIAVYDRPRRRPPVAS